MKLKKFLIIFLYFFFNHKKKRNVFSKINACKLITSKSFIFFSNFINKDLRSSTKFFISDKKNNMYLENPNIFYVCSDALEDFNNYLKKINRKFVLISGDSDRTISSKLKIYNKILKNKNLLCWYAQNCVSPNNKVKQIPIGLDYISQFHSSHSFRLDIYNNSYLPKKYEKKIIQILKRSENFNSRKNLIFCNYHFSLHGRDRLECFKKVDKKLCHFLDKKIPHIENFKQQSKYKFVLAPSGEGLDTHRVWEALLFGNIPIVKSSPLNKIYKNLPVLIVKSWDDINNKKLKNYSKKYNNKSYVFEKLLLDYWKIKIYKKNSQIVKLKNYEIFKKYLINSSNE